MKDITLESKAREDNGMGSRRDWLTSRHGRMKTISMVSSHRQKRKRERKGHNGQANAKQEIDTLKNGMGWRNI